MYRYIIYTYIDISYIYIIYISYIYHIYIYIIYIYISHIYISYIYIYMCIYIQFMCVYIYAHTYMFECMMGSCHGGFVGCGNNSACTGFHNAGIETCRDSVAF